MSDKANAAENMAAEDWAGEMGERWLRNLDRFESMIAPVGEALLQRADYQPGQSVLDIGCGGGASARAIAARVGPAGRVMGVDISPHLVVECERRAHAADIANVHFVAADAAAVKLPAGSYDRLHSRFGSMFFPEPAAAFRNLAGLVRSGGRADFAVWAPAKDNPWVGSMMGILRDYIELPKPEPHAPGPFALDDPNYFASLLRQAGFISLEFALWQGAQPIGGAGSTPESACDFVLNSMNFGDMLSEQPATVRAAVEARLLALFRGQHTPRGVEMQALAWLVSARRG
ncbi:MAG: methyltransferase domain-containing protein [Proteobacteria bacterium]|jgi:SAM-dependent methyltransferase|nr:methyltransferase domain-containing protein [Pseudomonadota bacterium]MCC6630729.1 methyltransferase domain-containing protein [Gammaproteobacteria bacterium]